MYEVATFFAGMICGSAATVLVIMFFMGANSRR